MSHVRSFSETRPCNNCQKPYRRRVDAAKKGIGLHCSIQCANEARHGPMLATPETLRAMYCGRDMTMKEIAAELGVGWRRVQTAVLALGIPTRTGRRRIPHKRSATTYRKLVKTQPGEVVHHLNCNETDDRVENLVAVSRQRHAALHKQLETLSAQLFKAGLITFDMETGYQLSPTLKTLVG